MSDFDALAFMAKNNQDVSTSTTVVRGNATKRGDEITMGTTSGHLEKIASGKYLFVLYVINAEQFDAAKKEVADASAQHPPAPAVEECGQGIQFGNFLVGCGRSINPSEVYRCYDCDNAFHKHCLKQHCTERKHGVKE